MSPRSTWGFRESHRQILLKGEPFAFGEDLAAALEPGGNLTFSRWAPVELNPDILADQLLATLDAIKAKRLVVDSAAELERAVTKAGDPNRVDNYLAAPVESLRMRGITALFTKEIPQTTAPELDFAQNPISVMAENVLLLRRVEHESGLTRLLSVIKMRFSTHDVSTRREFTIRAPEGVRLLPEGAGAAAETGMETGATGARPGQRGAQGTRPSGGRRGTEGDLPEGDLPEDTP